MPLVTLTEAARKIGYSTRSQLRRLKDSGRIDDFIVREGRKELIELNGLSDHIAAIIRPRADGNVCQKQPPSVLDDWEEVASIVDQWVDPNTFGAPPFSGDRLATIFECVNDAIAQIHGRD